jgi:hypothetical protein
MDQQTILDQAEGTLSQRTGTETDLACQTALLNLELKLKMTFKTEKKNYNLKPQGCGVLVTERIHQSKPNPVPEQELLVKER